jgi:4-amino-4-deoxy-L-arabinose transferase-like glycosyltransferase
MHAPFRLHRHLPLILALGIGLALRLVLWDNLPRQGMIGDEAEYLAAANWLAQGRGFTWHQQWLWTRAPLYPLFLAFHIRLFGMSLTPIFISQTILSLLNIVLVYLLACKITRYSHTDPRPPDRHSACSILHAPFSPPALAALLAAIFFPLATHAQILLSETLYLTLLLSGIVLLAHWADRPAHLRWLVLAGGVFGLATLTRGLTLGFLPLVAAWVWWVGRTYLPSSNAPTLQRSNAPTLQRSNAPTLQRSNAPTLQRSNALQSGKPLSFMRMGEAEAPSMGVTSGCVREPGSLTFPITVGFAGFST